MAAGPRRSGRTGNPPSGCRIRFDPERPERPCRGSCRDGAVRAIPRSVAGADSLVAHDPVDVAAQVRAARGEDTDCAVVLAVDDNRLNDGQTHGHVRRDRDRCRDADGLYLSLIHISEPTRLGMISYAV